MHVILVVEYSIMKASDKIARLEQELIKIREQSKNQLNACSSTLYKFFKFYLSNNVENFNRELLM